LLVNCFAIFPDSNLIERIRADVTTTQSSTFPYYNRHDVDSSKAIDGLRNYSVDTCKCCSVTDGISPSWWQIDLRSKYLIGALQIFGRAEDSGNSINNKTHFKGIHVVVLKPILT
jgi:hypothetical protein